MAEGLLLSPSESHHHFDMSAPIQGPSQDLLHTLLELGETFLSSEIGEDDLQDLETKISAARGRDYNTIRDLQKKIEELSGMSAMVSRLKNELREEKEKAKEEAEDLTQEMAELRYQLMERVEQERELRASTEEASLKRILELEEQVEQERKLRVRLELSLRRLSDLQQQVELEHSLRIHAEESLRRLSEVEEEADKERELRTGIEEASSRRILELEEEVRWLQARLEEAEGELQAENEQHVEALIQYEEERTLMEADLEAAKQSLNLSHPKVGHPLVEVASLCLSNSKEVNKDDKKLVRVEEYTQEECVDGEERELLLERKLRFEAERKQWELGSSLERTLMHLSAMERNFAAEKQSVQQYKQDLHSNECSMSRVLEEEKLMKAEISMLKQLVLEKEELLSSLTEELFLQKEANRSLMNRTSFLDSEMHIVREELQVCEAQANEMGLTITSLQEALLLESMKAIEGQEEMALLVKRLTKQDEEYTQLKVQFDALLSNLGTLHGGLEESKRREGEALGQVQKLGLELSLAKDEVVKSEVRLQRIMKQKDEQLNVEVSKLDGAKKQASWFLSKQTEHIKKVEAEKMQLHAELQQMRKRCEQSVKERDDLKVVYAEMESQFSRRRAVIDGAESGSA